jgi:hypothetical protein
MALVKRFAPACGGTGDLSASTRDMSTIYVSDREFAEYIGDV